MVDLKLNGLGKKEIQQLKNLRKSRDKIIEDTSFHEITTNFKTNEIASLLHPQLQQVKVLEIIEENEEAKTFILGPNEEKGMTSLAPFKAGQYISVRIRIGKGMYRRPYTLSCSPRLAFSNKYAITIKRKKEGIVSNYFLENISVGSSFVVSAPLGNFTYERIRDAKNVLAIAGGSGITPFISMAEAIQDKILNFNLTILYGAKKETELLFKERLNVLQKNNKIKVVYLLEEKKEGYLSGFITKELIDKYKNEETSYFVCGPIGLYEHMNTIFKEFDIAKKYIRHDLFFSQIDLKENKEYRMKILSRDREYTITCMGHETLLSAMERNGILTQSLCHVGECGFCRSKLVSGKIKTFDGNIRVGDKSLNFIHPCASFPESDIVIKLPN